MNSHTPKKNCWEFTKCGREPGGINERETGTCPAATNTKLDGVHGGTLAGRACWVVAGTFCQGSIQGTFAQKLKDCTLCQFYQLVRKQEGANYKISLELIKKLKE